MTARGCPLRRDGRGTAALEFGLALPVVMLLAVGIIDLGRLLGDQHALDRGVTVAARYAAVSSTSAGTGTITAQFTAAVQPLLGSCGTCTVTVSFSPSYRPGGTVTVAAQYPWSASLSMLALPSLTLNSSVTLTVLN